MSPIETWSVIIGPAAEQAPIRTITLKQEKHGHIATVRIERQLDGRQFVTYLFDHPKSPYYARAEAARALAVVYDTLGDIRSSPDEWIDVDNNPMLIGARLEVSGRDALLVSYAFFGECLEPYL